MKRNGLILAGLVLAALAVSSLRQPAGMSGTSLPSDQRGDMIPDSSSIEDMLQWSDEVFVGMTDAYSGTATVIIPTDPTIDPNDPEGFGIPTLEVANYSVQVYDVLTSERGMSAGESVPLQFISREPDEPQLSGAPLPGVRYLFFGTWLEDEQAYVVPELEAGLIVAEDPQGEVVFSYGPEVPFAAGMTFEEFEQAVRDAIAAQE